MKCLQIVGLALFSLFSLACHAENTYEYRHEFEAFKSSPRYEAIFNEDAPMAMRNLQADIIVSTQLSYFQRLARFMFLREKPVVINATNMPKLYAYIDSMCKDQHIKTPTIFISQNKSVLNAAAAKLLTSSGGIIIYPKMLLETTDAMLEAVIAHEIGHIKYNHGNKDLLILGLSCLASYIGIKTFVNSINFPKLISNALEQKQVTSSVFKSALIKKCWLPVGFGISRIIINKRFEKQADEFAYKTMGKAAGTIEFFEHLNNNEKKRDDYYKKTYTLLQESKKDLGFFDRIKLTNDYSKASVQHAKDKLYRWFYHNTPVGPHPSNDARIKAAKDYLASQAALTPQN